MSNRLAGWEICNSREELDQKWRTFDDTYGYNEHDLLTSPSPALSSLM